MENPCTNIGRHVDLCVSQLPILQINYQDILGPIWFFFIYGLKFTWDHYSYNSLLAVRRTIEIVKIKFSKECFKPANTFSKVHSRRISIGLIYYVLPVLFISLVNSNICTHSVWDLYYKIKRFFSGVHSCVNGPDAITTWINVRRTFM